MGTHKDKSIIYWNMNYKGKFRRTLWFIPLVVILCFLTEKERTVAKWVYINNKNAGPTTSTLQEAKALYLSIRRNDKIYGVIGIDMISNKALSQYEKSLIKTILNEFSLAMDSLER